MCVANGRRGGHEGIRQEVGGRFGGFVASTDSVARRNSSIDFVGERGACSMVGRAATISCPR